MIEPESLLDKPVSDSKFIDFWGSRSKLSAHVVIEDEHTISKPDSGISVVVDQNLRIKSVTMLLGKQTATDENYSPYQGILPAGLRFGMTKQEVLELLGAPDEENLEHSSFMGVEILPWAKYSLDGYDLNVTFDRYGTRVVGVCITASDPRSMP